MCTCRLVERLGNNEYKALNAVPDAQAIIILRLVPSTYLRMLYFSPQASLLLSLTLDQEC